MKTPTEPKDSWSYAHDLVGRCLPNLPKLERYIVGPFVFDLYTQRSFRFYRQGRVSQVRFSCPYPLELQYFRELAFWNGSHVRNSLSPLAIRSTDQVVLASFFGQDRISSDYPTFEYGWFGGHKSYDGGKIVSDDINQKGGLSFLRVDLADDTFVNFEAPSFKAYKHGPVGIEDKRRERLLAEVPNSLKGLEVLLGQPIPWQINFDEMGILIINQSGLEEFVIALETQKN